MYYHINHEFTSDTLPICSTLIDWLVGIIFIPSEYDIHTELIRHHCRLIPVYF